ncbi:hypothetical protein M406DRAFT_221726, partial [Cryphonectria parasitica EP155]
RPFHASSRRCRDDIDDKNHYETLQVQTDASPQDIKKSFYTLSKKHHPDHNRSDPHASRRFMRISEAHSVLSHPDKRAHYDRDVLRLHSHGHHHHGHKGPARGGASYASTGPVGSRPASGLSRRRGTFRGPPPSFYRSGGWGAHGAKRGQAHEESTSGAGRTANESNREADPGGYTGSYGTGGMGPGQEPFGRGGSAAGDGDIPHFDRAAKEAHTRTQARVDEIRAKKMAREFRFTGYQDYTEFGSFFAILAVLGAA